MVEFGSLGSKILTAVNSIAPVAGAASGWFSAPMAASGINGAPAFIIDRLSHWKIANPIVTTQIALGLPDSYPIIPGIISAITGMAIKEVGQAVDVGPITQMGNALSKFGASSALNALIAAWVWEAKNNPHAVEGGPSSGAGSAYVASAPTRGANTIDVDNPQGLAPLYSGAAPDYR